MGLATEQIKQKAGGMRDQGWLQHVVFVDFRPGARWDAATGFIVSGET